MESDVGPPAGGGFFSNKRNVLIAAGVLGAGIGLVFFMMRRSAPADAGSAGDTALGGTPMGQDALQMSNIANQLSSFRGESGVAAESLLNLTKKQGEQSAEQSARQYALTRAAAINEEGRYQEQWITDRANTLYVAFANAIWLNKNNPAMQQQLADDLRRQVAALATLRGKNPAPQTGQVAIPGAGGFDWHQWIPIPAYDAGMGEGSEAHALMSNAPVRYIGDLVDW